MRNEYENKINNKICNLEGKQKVPFINVCLFCTKNKGKCDLKFSQYFNISIFQYFNISMFQYLNISTIRFEHMAVILNFIQG